MAKHDKDAEGEHTVSAPGAHPVDYETRERAEKVAKQVQGAKVDKTDKAK